MSREWGVIFVIPISCFWRLSVIQTMFWSGLRPVINTVDEGRPTYSGSTVVMVDLGMFSCVEFAKANGLVKCDGDVWQAPNR